MASTLGASSTSTGFSFLRFRFFLRKLGGGEFLPIDRDLSDTDRCVSLSMSAKFLVLLFALVMKNQNLRAAALLHDLSGHQRCRLGTGDLAGLAGNCQHIAEFNFPVSAVALAFQPDHVAGRHPVLLSSGADDRVHTYASVQSYAGRVLARFRGTCCCACCFPPRRFGQQCGTAPERSREYRQTHPF